MDKIPNLFLLYTAVPKQVIGPRVNRNDGVKCAGLRIGVELNENSWF
jgi:hypothetical protein